ncbi:MAG: AAA family ATPase [Rhodospirillales bacterium]
MLQFNRLRITGFKSFVDPAELLIEPGLTGIVGPNGCGKSNLVEALRWVMGETSAKQLRGGEMDDVIFAGSGERPGRNIAEVTLDLDNKTAAAPPPWTGMEELLVSRRIERARGSSYRVNGREVRARDVHLLFADAASGARSAAMVTQGQVSQLIAAKPVERRALLEEAAGIVGLHARRNEAEQRLQAAEANLPASTTYWRRWTPSAASYSGRRKQAGRYRTLSAQIRKLEATIWWLRWQAAQEGLAAAQARLATAEQVVAGATGTAAAAALRQADAAAAVPQLRQADGEAGGGAAGAGIRARGAEAEERRVAREAEAARAVLRQASMTTCGATRRGGGRAGGVRSAGQRARPAGRAPRGEAAEIDRAEAALAAASADVAALEDQANRLTEQVAAGRAGGRRAARPRRGGPGAAPGAGAQGRGGVQRQQAASGEEARLAPLADAEAAAATADAEAEAARAAPGGGGR